MKKGITHTEYSLKLLHPAWKALTKQVFSRDGRTCCQCGNSKRELHCHHLSYDLSKEPYDYPLENFVTLCYICHGKVHNKYVEQEPVEKIQGHDIIAGDNVPELQDLNNHIRMLQELLKTEERVEQIDNILKRINELTQVRINNYAAWQQEDRLKREENERLLKHIPLLQKIG